MWKDIIGWEKYYEINENGDVRNKITQKLIVGDKNTSGYLRVTLYHKPNKQRYFRHRLVAENFLPNPYNLKEVNHIDENKNNNHISNLEWVSRKENERKNHRSNSKKYTPFQVYYNNGNIKEYEFVVDFSEELGVSKRTILNYLQGKSNGYIKFGIIKLKYIKA